MLLKDARVKRLPENMSDPTPKKRELEGADAPDAAKKHVCIVLHALAGRSTAM